MKKINKKKMMIGKYKIFGLAFIASITLGQAQDFGAAKKAIDAEQYENAKAMLKAIVKANPASGKGNFLLGNVFLTQNVVDSAKIAFNNGLGGKDDAELNYIGLGQIELDKGNTSAAEADFALAIKSARRKDTEQLVGVGRAYTNSNNPNYKKAIEILTKAKDINSNDATVQLALGDAYYGDNNQNEAYASYRNAFQIEPSMIRAKMQLGVLLKGAKSYDEAIKSFNEVIAVNPSYGPVYRELAETYYKWGRNKPSKSKEYMQTAIEYYEKYLGLTDRSLSSRMRHADFLVLVQDYKALESEANKMIEMDKVNPRIFRYLGYSAYENGNIDLALKSLNTFIASPDNKVIGMDYIYLAKSKFKKGTSADGLSINPEAFAAGMADLKKAIEIVPESADELNELGINLFKQKMYNQAASVFELGTSSTEFKNYLDDNVYYGLSIYYANIQKDVVVNNPDLQKADVAFDRVLTASPAYLDAYLYKARINNTLKNDEMAAKFFEEFTTKVNEKGPEEAQNPNVKPKMIEAYNNVAAFYANQSDKFKADKVLAADYKAKAIDNLNKTLLLDSANAYANSLLNNLKL